MLSIITLSLRSTSSLLQLRRKEFCDISSPEVATPPAFDAFPGAKSTLALRNTSTASGVEGIFAPSAIHIQPFATSCLASSPLSSFWVAQGKAISHFTSHGLPPSIYIALGYLLIYSL